MYENSETTFILQDNSNKILQPKRKEDNEEKKNFEVYLLNT